MKRYYSSYIATTMVCFAILLTGFQGFAMESAPMTPGEPTKEIFIPIEAKGVRVLGTKDDDFRLGPFGTRWALASVFKYAQDEGIHYLYMTKSGSLNIKGFLKILAEEFKKFVDEGASAETDQQLHLKLISYEEKVDELFREALKLLGTEFSYITDRIQVERKEIGQVIGGLHVAEGDLKEKSLVFVPGEAICIKTLLQALMTLKKRPRHSCRASVHSGPPL